MAVRLLNFIEIYATRSWERNVPTDERENDREPEVAEIKVERWLSLDQDERKKRRTIKTLDTWGDKKGKYLDKSE